MNKRLFLPGTVMLLLALLAPSPAYAATDCVFAIRQHAMRLTADCTTDATILVPDGFTLNGNGHTITAVDPPGDHFRGAVVQNAGATANVRNLAIKAAGLADVCDTDLERLTGIRFLGASGNIRKNTVLDFNQGASACEEGNAIEVDNFVDNPNTVNVRIENNVVSAYQSTGILANGNVFVVVKNNTVTGLGAVDHIAQNGIQFGFSALGKAERNLVSGNVFTGTGFASAGILLFSPGDDIRIERNDVSRNDVGIWLAGASLAKVLRNTAAGSTFDGIAVDDQGGNAQDNLLVRNEVTSSFPGIGLYGAATMKNIVKNNKTDGNAAGIFIDLLASFNILRNNEAHNNEFDGIFVEGNSNTIRKNEAFGNGIFDIENAGTDNRYIENECATSSGPPVDCPEGDSDDDNASRAAQLKAHMASRGAPSPFR